MAKIRALIIVIAVAVVTACSSGSTATGIGAVNFGGVWVFFLVPTLYQKSQLELRARVNESDGTLSGTVAAIQTDFPECFQGGTVTGSVNDAQVTIVFTDDDIGAVISLSGTLRGSRLDGTWSISGGPAITSSGSSGSGVTMGTTIEPVVTPTGKNCSNLRGDFFAEKVRT